jgi:hypothetical protein
VCREVFDSVLGAAPNQLDRQRPEVSVTAADLLAVAKTPGGITEAGAARQRLRGPAVPGRLARRHRRGGDLQPWRSST